LSATLPKNPIRLQETNRETCSSDLGLWLLFAPAGRAAPVVVAKIRSSWGLGQSGRTLISEALKGEMGGWQSGVPK